MATNLKGFNIVSLLNLGSLAGASIVVLGYCVLVDVTRHLLIAGISPKGEGWCNAVSFYVFFIDNLYMFLNVAIASNLLFLSVCGWLPKFRTGIYFVAGSLFLAFFTSVTPLAMGALGRNAYGLCYIASHVGDSERLLYYTFLVYLTLIPGAIFCLVVPIFTNLWIGFRFRNVPLKLPIRNYDPTIKNLVLRVSVYPLTSFFCIFGYALLMLQTGLFGRVDTAISYWSTFGLCSTGLANFVAFLFDPAFKYIYTLLFGRKIDQLPVDSNGIVYLPDDDEGDLKAPPSSPNPEPAIVTFHKIPPPPYAHNHPDFVKLMAYLDLY
ncbi:hypothetical protein L0F63_002619 [Massospora cicadina]|nr:hypothetical protein L0F63_002619 [Massospora cicadina]